MGRPPKSQAEIEAFKNRVLDETLVLFRENGYEGFSIRKLGPRLGIAPKTIYNYFKSKEEIYIRILTKGFELLYDELSLSVNPEKDDPLECLKSIARSFARFGFEKSNYYDLMFTWHVPKFYDFMGTELEHLAYLELEAALKSFNLVVGIVDRISETYGYIAKEDSRKYVIQMLSSIHGIIALKNNTLLSYLHEDPDALIHSLLENILIPMRPSDIQYKGYRN